MSNVLIYLAGLWSGGIAATIALALCVAAGRADREMEDKG